MADRTFTCYSNLPDEIKLHIWREAVRQAPPCVFELNELLRDDGQGYIKIGDINLPRKSVPFHRPLLEVDKLSRKEILKHFQRVKFHNVHVWFNVDIDIIYYGGYIKDNLRGLLNDADRDPADLDPFFKTVQHFAFGVDAFLGYLELESEEENENEIEDEDEDDEDERDYENPKNWGLREMQRLSSARSITVVLDGVQWDEREDSIPEGSITFGSAGDCITGGMKAKKRHFEWISYLKEEWNDVAERHPKWNVPKLTVKSISRGGTIELPDFNKWPGSLLPDWIRDDQRHRYMLIDDDSDDGGSDDEGSNDEED